MSDTLEKTVENWYFRAADGAVYGPSDMPGLIAWARDGRVDPSGHVSRDRRSWIPPQMIPELEMKWIVETEPGKFFGPFHRDLVIRLVREGVMPQGASCYRKHELAIDEDPPPKVVEKVVEKIVEKIVEKEVRVEVPVEKIVEKEVRVEVPVEPPARTEFVVPEIVEPVNETPPSPRSFLHSAENGASKMAALEAALQKEIAVASRQGRGFSFLGGKH